jgi:hypothetical protein
MFLTSALDECSQVHALISVPQEKKPPYPFESELFQGQQIFLNLYVVRILGWGINTLQDLFQHKMRKNNNVPITFEPGNQDAWSKAKS